MRCLAIRNNRRPLTAFRIFRPALPAKVDLRDEPLLRVSFNGLRGQVMAASGPWRTSGDWWREDAWHQDEWDLELRFEPFHVDPASRANCQRELPQASAAWRLLHLFRLHPPRLVRAGSLRLTMYIELHARSAFSFLEGSSTPEELASSVRRARHGRHGSARPRRRLRLSSLSSRRAKSFPSTRTSAPKSPPRTAGAIRCSSNRKRDIRIFAA